MLTFSSSQQIQTQARRIKPTAKVVEAEETRKMKKDDDDSDENVNNGVNGGNSSDESGDISGERSDSDEDVKVSKYHQQRMTTTGSNRLVRPPPLQPQKPLKLKIKLPPKPGKVHSATLI